MIQQFAKAVSIVDNDTEQMGKWEAVCRLAGLSRCPMNHVFGKGDSHPTYVGQSGYSTEYYM
jgi:hypothetical protein